MTVLITGASGVVGRPVLRKLASQGPARALARSAAAEATVLASGGIPIAGDILDTESLRNAMDGCDVVFHVAGRNETCPRDPEQLYRVNVDGTKNVLEAAVAAGVTRVVYTSSAATIGEEQGTVGTERTAHRGSYLSHYERSKHIAEQAALSTTGVEVVSVNPSSVQGPGRSTGTGKLILDAVNGRLPFMVDSTVGIIDIDDCANGHLLAAERGRPGERYLLNGFTMTTRELIELLSRVAGISKIPRFLPGWVARAAAASIGAPYRLVAKQPPICREMVDTLLFGHSYDGSRAADELGLAYTPPEETVGRLLRWFVSKGLVTRDLPGLG